MIDSLLQRLNAPVKHRARATPAHTMPNSRHFQPFLSRRFTAATWIAHSCIKDPRDRISRGKETAEEWLDVHRIWHRMGGRSPCPMLYAPVETLGKRVDDPRQLPQ